MVMLTLIRYSETLAPKVLISIRTLPRNIAVFCRMHTLVQNAFFTITALRVCQTRDLLEQINYILFGTKS